MTMSELEQMAVATEDHAELLSACKHIREAHQQFVVVKRQAQRASSKLIDSKFAMTEAITRMESLLGAMKGKL